jgi:protein involved in sex pheromone biosynthesis
VRHGTILIIAAVTLILAACDNTFHDFDYKWADKIHADSPSRSYVAYIRDEKTSSSLLIAFEGGEAVAMRFNGIHLPLELQWLDSSTLQVRYPKEVRPTSDEDAADHVVDCFGPKVRILPVQI